jgi:hypothetical protein
MLSNGFIDQVDDKDNRDCDDNHEIKNTDH